MSECQQELPVGKLGKMTFISLEKNVYDWWCSVKRAMELSSDTELVAVLLKHFEKFQDGRDTQPTFPCIRCQRPLSLQCSWCRLSSESASAQSRELSGGEYSRTSKTDTSTVDSHSAHAADRQEDSVIVEQIKRERDMQLRDSVSSEEGQRISNSEYSEFKSSQVKSSIKTQNLTATVSMDKEDEDFTHISLAERETDDENTHVTRDEFAKAMDQSSSHSKSVENSDIGSSLDCEQCQKTFLSLYHLKKHKEGRRCDQSLKEHSVCKVCGESFRHLENYKKHMKTHHGVNRPFECNKCDKTFCTEKGLRVHEALKTSHHDLTQSFTCETCHKTLPTLRGLKIHQSRTCLQAEKTSRRKLTHPFTCNQCGKNFSTSKGLKLHQLRTCQSTPKNPETKHSIDNSSHGEGIGPISKDNTGNSDGERKISAKKVEGFNLYPCTECGKLVQNLRSHKLRVHTPKPYICTVCGKGFVCRTHLQLHISRHTGKRTFTCEICSAAFFNKYGLNQHLKMVHLKKRSRSLQKCICEVCGAVLGDHQSLKYHRRIHTGERPHKCSYCNATFRLLQILRKHERKHKGERKYVCTECGRGFTEHEYLKSHMRIHTGERPFVCDICGAGFAQKGSLNSHRKTHKLTVKM